MTTISYRGLMRYSGIGSPGSIARAVLGLHALHAITIQRVKRPGAVQGCNGYRLTLDAPEFMELLNKIYTCHREEIAQERAFREELRLSRQRATYLQIPALA
jgi:hypothetical protein